MDEQSPLLQQGTFSQTPPPLQQRQFQHLQHQQLLDHATINQATMDVTSSPESDTVEIQVQTTPGVVSSPNHDDDDDDASMVLDVTGSSSNTSNLINDNDTGSTTEYVEILEDYTEPMFPETNIEVETSGGCVTHDEPTTATTLQTIINEAAQSSEPDKSPAAPAPPSQTQPQIYYIYNSSSSNNKSQQAQTAASTNTPTTTATIKQVIEPLDSQKIIATSNTTATTTTTIVQKKSDEESAGPSEEKTTSETKLFMCGVCKIILEKRYLANHMKKHLQQVNETHTCRICKDTFSRKMLLSVHISQKHSIFTKDYVCQICKLPYDENNNDLHGGCHWFCNICSKTFMTKASMVCHSRMRHNRKFPFIY